MPCASRRAILIGGREPASGGRGWWCLVRHRLSVIVELWGFDWADDNSGKEV
jgi:hypothetical protein